MTNPSYEFKFFLLQSLSLYTSASAKNRSIRLLRAFKQFSIQKTRSYNRETRVPEKNEAPMYTDTYQLVFAVLGLKSTKFNYSVPNGKIQQIFGI